MSQNIIDFKIKLEKKLQDKDLAESLILYYEDLTQRIIDNILLKHIDKKILTEKLDLKEDLNFNSADYYSKKLKELTAFECFEYKLDEALNKNIEALEEILTEDDLKILKIEKEICLKKYKKLKKMKEREIIFLGNENHIIKNSFFKYSIYLYLIFSLYILIQSGFTSATLSIAVLLSLSFSTIYSTGEYFEKLRFRSKRTKIVKQKFLLKGVNFISILYFICFSIITILLSCSSIFFMLKQTSIIFSNNNIALIENLLMTVLFTLTSFKCFKVGMYNKRELMYNAFKDKITERDLNIFLKLQIK